MRVHVHWPINFIYNSFINRDLVEQWICGRIFHREADKARHKCLNECQKPVCQQQGLDLFSVEVVVDGLEAEVVSLFIDVSDC